MGAIETIFFYRGFLCVTYRTNRWRIFCTTDEEFYGYVGKEGGRTKAKNEVDHFCKLRAAEDDRQQPYSRYTAVNWGKNYLLPVTNYQLLI
jgi:hypothetical protein